MIVNGWAGRWLRQASAWCALAICVAAPMGASAAGVVISQVYGANGNAYANDYVELFNAGTAAVDVTGWSVQYSSATGTGLFSANGISALSGVLQPGQYTLVKLASAATGAALPTPNITGAATNLSTSGGKVVLVNVSAGLACNGGSTPCNATQTAQIVDLVGYGTSNFFEGSAAAPSPGTTAALFRNGGGCADTGNNSADFSVGTPAPRTTATALAPCGGAQAIVPVCPSTLTTGAGFALNAALRASDGDSIVNAATITSAPVAGISLSAFTAAPAAGGTANVTLTADATTAAGTYPVTVNFSNADGQTASCTVTLNVVTAGAYTPIYSIQGSGATAALQGVRTTRGIVTLVTNNGYFLQDETGDGDPATSDGIFVFTSTAPTVTAGQRVQVTGTVTEFDVSLGTANPVAEANPLTEIINVTSTIALGTGTITPTVVTLPLASAADFERYEGMLVTLAGPLTVTQNFFQGRYGQVTLGAGRLMKPTNLYRPGTPEALALAAQNARSMLLLDDASSLQNPNPTPYIGADNTLRAGDTVQSVTGVIDYGLATNNADSLSLYRIQPTAAPVITRTNPRTASPPAVGGTVKVASFNVLNYFTTFSDGTNAAGATGQVCTQGGSTPAASLCRGADNLAEFQRQQAKIVQAMAAINADVFGLMEMQNNGDTAVQNLVTALNAVVGAGTYAVVPQPPTTGTDAIRVAMIYKPGTLTLSGSPMSDGSAIHNRPPFAQAFVAGGQKFSVIVNHFKSKSCDAAAGADLDQGDGQGCYNDRRKQQATALLAFVASVQAAAGDNDVVLIGDFNAYGAEDPIDVLTTGGLVNQITRFEPNGYSFVFDGEAGYLDHALTTASLSVQVANAAHWHINADEPSVIDYNTEFKAPAGGCTATCPPDLYSATPYRSSDHDPVIVGLALSSTLLPQTITFHAPADRALNAGPFIAQASASSGLAVGFAGSTPAVCTVTQQGSVTLVGTGTCTLTASQPGNASFAAAAPVTRSFVVSAAAAAQTITFNPLPDAALAIGSVTLAASASSGLAVVYSSQTPAVCTVTGNTLSLLSAGLCTVAADQPGSISWLPATQVLRSFTVSAATAGADEADIPTLPEWGLLLLGASLMARGLRRRANA